MSYSVNWIAKVVTIPSSDLTLVSGTRYRLNMIDFLIEIRRLEAALNGGLWAAQILVHSNPRLDFAGADYAGFDEVVNEYTITFEPPATRVDLLGSNNNLIDVLNVNGVSVVPGNSAGLQRVTSGSGLSVEQDQNLSDIYDLLAVIEGGKSHKEVMRVMSAVLAGKLSGAGTGTETFKGLDGVTDRVVSTVDESGNRTAVTLNV